MLTIKNALKSVRAQCSLGILISQSIVQLAYSAPSIAQSTPSLTAASFSQQYSQTTKEILLTGIELERFSLHFRMESAKQPKFRRLRYFATQEAGAAGGLAFETTGVVQFGRGRKRPLQIDKRALRGALAATTVTSLVASSGSLFELGANVVQMAKNKHNGYDPKSANKYVATKLHRIDELLALRDSLIQAHPDDPSYAKAIAEGKVLKELHNSFVNEYSHFNADTIAYRNYQNLFYLLNASYNGVGAMAADVAYRAIRRPHLNGTANVLFIVSGSMAMVTPIICQAYGKYSQNHAYAVLKKEIGEAKFDPDQFAADCKNLTTAGGAEGSLIPSLPVTERVGIYTQSADLFTKQLDSETKTMRKLEKVALQSSLLGPPIGACLMTQGILGTYGYYHYPIQPRKQINQYYCGAIVGTVGTSAAVVGNAASLLGTLSYEHKLMKQNKLPVQLIEARLKHLDELEKTVTASLP